MKLNRLKIVSVSAIVAALAPMTTTSSQAATCTVPTDHANIQTAVNDTNCSTINVLPGTYTENVTVGRTVTINGAQAGNGFSGRTSGGPAESTVQGANPIGANSVFIVNAATVVIDGFTVKNALTTGGAAGIDVKVNGNDAFIANNIFDGITTSDTSGNGTAQAVYLEGGPDGVSIVNNEMKNVTSNRSAKGVLIGDNGKTDPSRNVLVQGNSIHDISSSIKGAYGVSVANVTPGTSDLHIYNNVVNNLTGGGWVHALGVEGDAPNFVATGNDISNLNGPSPDKIAVWFENEDVSFSTSTINGNNFNVNAPIYGIAVDAALSGSPLDGTCNWWNSSTGPTSANNPGGTGAQVSSNVTFSPWLLSPAPDGSCGGGLSAKDCHKAVEQNEKEFNDMQKAEKMAFNSQPHTKAEKKAFEDQQKADKAAFQQQYKADEKACGK
jgi:hypothetical protein